MAAPVPVCRQVYLVVLVTGLEPHDDSEHVAQTFHITKDRACFFLEAHPKLRPFHTNTDGIFLAGTCPAPAATSRIRSPTFAAAAGAMSLMGERRGRHRAEQRRDQRRPCAAAAEYATPSAPTRPSSLIRRGRVSEINTALCKGCGVCIAACPSEQLARQGTTTIGRYLREIEGLLVG